MIKTREENVTLTELQRMVFQQYLKDEKDKIYNPHADVGDVAELGLICEEIGEAMRGIREQKGEKGLEEECGDIIVRTICFMSRKGIDLQDALLSVHEKNTKRNRKGLYVEGCSNGERF